VLNAAEHSIRQLGYEDAVVLLSRALDELEPDDAERSALVQALGDARARTGDSDGARRCFAEAARLAREVGDPDLFARAALGAAGLSIIIAPVREDIRALLAEASDALDPLSPLRPAVLGRLSVELYYEPARIREQLSEEALIAGRRVGGRPLLPALIARHVALWSPDYPEERLAIADEIVAAARAARDREAELQGMNWRVVDLWELGDMEAAHAAIETHARLADELRLLAYLWYAPMWRATLSMLAGRLDDATTLVEEGARIGRLAHDENAALLFDIQRLTLRSYRGELAAPDWEGIQRHSTRPSTPGGAWTAWLVILLLERGQAEEAARLLAEAVAGVAALPMDANWLYVVATLGVGAAFLGDMAAAAELYARLLPYAGRIVVVGRGASCYGVAAYSLGLLASVLRDDGAAERHLTDAVETDDRIGAVAFAAAARHELARVLERRGEHARASTLHAESIAAGRRLGMTVPDDILRRF
jgi:tetratricopeptide (TPR) repeat protein